MDFMRRTKKVLKRPGMSCRSGGFTLLEMLAVIVLIGLVSAYVVTKVNENLNKGKYKAGAAQVLSLDAKVQQYEMENGSPPASLKDLVSKPANAPNWQGPYAKPSEIVDPWGHAFGYQYPGQHGRYDIIFYGEDGRSGGDDLNKDVGNWQ
jgi:general secretion pathway protein G